MAIRYVKVALVAFVSLMCLMYATQNVVNLQAAHFFVSSAASMAGHEAYPASFGPALESPALAWLVLAVIIAAEISAGLLAARGAWDLWRARTADAATFNAAKGYAMLGGGVALVVWFGFFTAIGGAYFQMWQTDLGRGALGGAFQYATQIGVVLLFVNTKDR